MVSEANWNWFILRRDERLLHCHGFAGGRCRPGHFEPRPEMRAELDFATRLKGKTTVTGGGSPVGSPQLDRRWRVKVSMGPKMGCTSNWLYDAILRNMQLLPMRKPFNFQTHHVWIDPKHGRTVKICHGAYWDGELPMSFWFCA